MKRLWLFLVLFGLPISAYSAGGGRPLTPAEVNAVVQAVEDEIYAGGDYSDFYQIGENTGTPQHWKSRVHIYINPEYGGDFEGNQGGGEAIYKFMPDGEIIRFFKVLNGQVELMGNPQIGFPITQPSHRTVFDDDETICELKQRWLKRFFVVDVLPSREIIQEASRRQTLRTEVLEREQKRQEPE